MRNIIYLLAVAAILCATSPATAQTAGESGAATGDDSLEKAKPRETTPPAPVLPQIPPEQQAGPDAQATRNQASQAALISDEQRVKMGEMRSAFRQETMPLFVQLREATGELGTLLEVERPDKAKVDAAVTKVIELQRKILERRVIVASSMWNLFTPEQKEALIKRGQSPLDMVPAGAYGDGSRREMGPRTVRPAPAPAPVRE